MEFKNENLLKGGVLSLLRSTKEFLSGEEASRHFGVTRAAIWKQVKQLREEGFVIESRSHRGYRLLTIPDRLYSHVLSTTLKTSVFGQQLHYFATTGSTNAVARRLADDGATEGTVVIAEKQTQGRGRRGREWSSPFAQGIWVSLILRPKDLEPSAAHRLTLLAAVAANEAICETTGVRAGIKWPNDILVNKRKVCGILTEIKAELDMLHYLVVGCGINVNQQEEDFPSELRTTAVSLRQITGEKHNRLLLLQIFLQRVEELYRGLVDGNFEDIRCRWLKANITLGQQVEVSKPNCKYYGEALDIDNEGALLVKSKDGQVYRFIAGEVSLR